MVTPNFSADIINFNQFGDEPQLLQTQDQIVANGVEPSTGIPYLLARNEQKKTRSDGGLDKFFNSKSPADSLVKPGDYSVPNARLSDKPQMVIFPQQNRSSQLI